MKTIKPFIAGCAATLLAVAVYAQDPAPNSSADAPEKAAANKADPAGAAINPDEVNQLAKPFESAGELVEKDRDAYLAEHKINIGGPDAKGRFFYFAKESVSVPVTSDRWARARVLAYDKAVNRARSEFVRDMFGKQVVEEARIYFSDNSDGREEFPEDTSKNASSALGAVFNKVLALTETKLDKALGEAGVDPSKYANKSLPQKRLLFQDQFVRNAGTKAVGSVSGMTVVQTFAGNDGQGNYCVGVILMYSPAMRQLAYDITNKRTPLLTGTPRQSIQDMIPADQALLNEAFGLRVGFDLNGQPCIISFGQWASSYSGKDVRRMERERETAERQALQQADAYITIFQNANMEVNDSSIVGESIDQTLTKDRDGNITDMDSVKLIDIINEKSKLRANADMLGRSTAKKWSHTTPEGHRFSGVVRVWTVSNLEAAQGVRNWKPESKPKAAQAPQQPKPKEQDAGVKRGPSQDLNDF